MGLSVTNNIASLTAQHNLDKTSSMLAKSLERLSSGLKINRGADGPAALVISEEQRAQIAGLNKAIENTGKAVSMVQTAEGALNEINALLLKARSLALDSANAGVNDNNALAANQAELSNLLETIDRIANNTQFGTKRLLNGAAQENALAATDTGVNVTGTLTTTPTINQYTYSVSTAAVKADVTGAAGFAGAGGTVGAGNGGSFTINGISVTLADADTVATSVTKINNVLATNGINVTASNSGGQLRLTSSDFTTDITVAAGTITLADIGLAAATTTHTDGVLDYIDSTGATVSVTGTGNSFALTGELSGATVTLLADTANPLNSVAPTNATFDVGQKLIFQIGPNANQTATLSIGSIKTQSLGVGASIGVNSLSDIDVTSAQGAQDALAVIDQAIGEVTNKRGDLGAFQSNTLESTANNLRATLENTVSAESVIRDTDFAAETANFTKSQVLMQVGTTVLQNANATSQLVLNLLK